MISTKPIDVVLEAPNFGFGPISSALMLARALAPDFKCAIMSSGAALAQAKRTMPELEFIGAETFHESGWEAAKVSLPRDAIVVCNTNPHFAAWLGARGLRVGVYDTLYWMWNELPSGIETIKFYVAQWYFGRSTNRSDSPKFSVRVTAPPRVSANVGARQTGPALLCFGGMGLPTRPDFPRDYARWICSLLAPYLAAHGVELEVIGAYPGLRDALRGHGGLTVIEPVPGPVFLNRLATARHLFLTPGLTSIYETDALGRRPFWLPGYSLSMVLQSRDYFQRTSGSTFGYVWPWADEVLAACETVAEAEAVALVCDNAIASIQQGSTDFALLQALEQYLKRTTQEPTLNRVVPDLEEPGEVVAGFVRQLTVV